MKQPEINTYRNRQQAERATALRSRNACIRGQCSQFELRQLGPNGFVGGPCGEMAKRFPGKPVVAYWFAGYRA